MNVVSKSFNGAKIPQQLTTPLSINQSRISSDKHKNLSLMKGASHSLQLIFSLISNQTTSQQHKNSHQIKKFKTTCTLGTQRI
jgi:hypothetical protein